MANSNSDTLNYIESFLTEVNKMLPSDKLVSEQKRLLDALNEGHDVLCADQEKLKNLFTKEFESLQKIGDYPRVINNYHNAIAFFTGLLLTSLGGLGLTYWLGGSNLAAWSTTILLVDFAIGAGFGAGVSTPLKIGMKNHFKENGKKSFIEKIILARLRERQKGIAKLDAEIELYMNDLLKGQYSPTQTRQKQKTRYNPLTKKSSTYTKNVEEFKKSFKVLPRATRKKLNKAMKALNEDYADISSTSCAFIGKSILTTISEYERKASEIRRAYIPEIQEKARILEEILELSKPTQKQIKEAYEELIKSSEEFNISLKSLSDISTTINKFISLATDVQNNIGTEDTELVINKAIERGNNFLGKSNNDILIEAKQITSEAKSIVVKAQKRIEELKALSKQKRIVKTVVETEQQNVEEINNIEKEIQKAKETTKKKTINV